MKKEILSNCKPSGSEQAASMCETLRTVSNKQTCFLSTLCPESSGKRQTVIMQEANFVITNSESAREQEQVSTKWVKTHSIGGIIL